MEMIKRGKKLFEPATNFLVNAHFEFNVYGGA
jgi:hypothetical protein